ncbi:hypothetical protein LUZ60_000639 [Juncus effusus]|nr:hypothetical protein LUZ60_000639 [Juncus effusus]
MGVEIKDQIMGYLLGLSAIMMLAVWAVRFLIWTWFRPKRFEKILRAQGLKGNPYRFPAGDLKEMARLAKEVQSKPMPLSHDITPRVNPMLHYTMKRYGKISFMWFGPYPRVILRDPELVKQVLSNKFGHFQKPNINPSGRGLARGVATYEREKWAKHRRIINPAFHIEKIKSMFPAFQICCDELIDRWGSIIGSENSSELDVWPECQSLTGDAISRTAFGSNYKEGRRIFQLQQKQAELFLEALSRVYVPFYRYLPTKTNRLMNETSDEVESILRNLIAKKQHAIIEGQQRSEDLLGLLLELNMKDQEVDSGEIAKNSLTIEDIIEECKLFYFAGQETTAVLLTWTLIALSMHPTWQTRARDEVLEIFGGAKPTFEGLSKLKIVTMILYEVLRLYPAATFLTRETYKTMKLENYTFPPGVQFLLPILYIHHDADFWGPDVSQFNPNRFSEGVSKASLVPGAFIPFGGGPRICLGQNFAMIEAKMCLVRILQQFSFELSPSYAHTPHTVLTLHPQFGAPLIISKV